jgi:hypothetical protein
MEIGEPIKPAVSPTSEETKYLRAEVIKVVFESTIRVSVAKATVKEPHWEKGQAVEESTWSLGRQQISGLYSKRPAVYLRKSAGGSRVATVTVKITASNVSGTGKLVGVLSSLRFEGDCPLGAGEHIVVAELKDVPDAFNGFSGNMGWTLEGSELSAALNGTRVEVFFIYANPHKAYKDGVWVEALRFLATRPLLRGTGKPADAAAKVVRYCHGHHGLKYDNLGGGGSQYGVSNDGGTFRLSGYMERDEEYANCYDQAGAVESLCGAAGIIVEWIYLEPYGFMKPTNLLGYGLCNNPFFMRSSDKIVGINEESRWPFHNHAFSRLAAKMLDACAGPHVGTESAAEYIDSSIDDQTTLYRNPRSHGYGMRAGKAGDMVACSGVRAVS